MKSIATINFKGGVGKTTVTWLLAKYVAERKKKKVLVVDTDAQMSLTLAIQLQETGKMIGDFENWYDNQHLKNQKTLLAALEKYDTLKGGHFDFPINSSFIYKMSEYLHFVPSVVDLYWLELEVFDKEKAKHFIRALLGKMEHTKEYNFDYVFFDCPPNFTALSYSVLSCSSLILIPVNPDVFASRGIGLMVDGLRYRIEPWPNPKLAVFMNKAKERVGQMTRETLGYLREANFACDSIKKGGVNIDSWDSFIPDRVSIKRAIPGQYFPDEFEHYFANLWSNVENSLR